MSDMSATIEPKSDQLNADSLISGPRTITITRVAITPGEEQPVSIYFSGDDGKPFRICKSMRRVLVTIWGPDAAVYTGRSMTIFRDPSVTWGGMEVGGIRISHLSHIDAPVVLALTATKKARKPYRVLPLIVEKSAQPEDVAAGVAADLIARIDALQTPAALAELNAHAGATARRDRLRDSRPELSAKVEAAIDAARARLTTSPLDRIIALIEASDSNDAIDDVLRDNKAQIGEFGDDQRAQLETAMAAQRHGFRQRATA